MIVMKMRSVRIRMEDMSAHVTGLGMRKSMKMERSSVLISMNVKKELTNVIQMLSVLTMTMDILALVVMDIKAMVFIVLMLTNAHRYYGID